MSTSTLSPVAAAYLSLPDALARTERAAASAQDRAAVLDALLSIWRTIFDRQDITEADDFFLLGGHSLKALQLQVHVRSALQYEMDLRCLFDAPTVGELADYISADSAKDKSTAEAAPSGNLSFHLRLKNIDPALWERAANQAVAQHESLRALLSTVEGAPRLRILPYQPFTLPVIDLARFGDVETEADRRLALDSVEPFDLSSGPLYRFAFYQTGPDRAVVSLTAAPGLGDANMPRTILREMLAGYPTAKPASPVPAASNDIDAREAAAECLVPLRREGSRTPLFMVAGGGGGTMNYIELTRALSPDQPVYGIQAKGYSTKSMPHTRIEAMAAYYIAAIRTVQPKGPYFLFGYSFGGMPALEMAQQLRAQGETVAFLGILDTWIRQDEVFLTPDGWGRRALIGRVIFRVRELLTTRPDKLPGYLRTRWRRFRFRTGMNRKVNAYQRMADEGKEIPAELANIQALAELSMRDYEPKPYPGKITLFQAKDNSAKSKVLQEQAWRQLAGEFELVPVPGVHKTMMLKENAPALARIIEAHLPP